MIIFGTRGVTYSKGNSDFHCPTCSAQEAYKHKRIRRFFTLYFIPVIPLDMVGEYVECQKCKGTYKLDVLDFDPSEADAAFKAEFHSVMLRVMVMMMLADGVIDEEEISAIIEVHQQLTNQLLTEQEIRAEAAQAQTDGSGIDVYLASIAGNLNDMGKEMVVRSAFMVASADGEFQIEEQQLISEIGSALGMTPAHFNGVLSELDSANSATA